MKDGADVSPVHPVVRGVAWPDCDEVQLGDYETVGHLMIALKSELALPVILISQGGRARHLVRPANKDAIIQGLLLAIEHRMEVSG